MVGGEIFIGNEIEGVDIGEKTAFFPKHSVLLMQETVSIRRLLDDGICRFYFGAGNLRGVSSDEIYTIEQILFIKPDAIILLEVDSDTEMDLLNIPKEILSFIHIIFVIDTKIETPQMKVFKFVTPSAIHWYQDFKSLTTNSINDKEYSNDYKLK